MISFETNHGSLIFEINFAVLLLWIIFVICVSCHTVLSISCSLVVTCLERADILALLYRLFPCVVVTFPYGVLGQV